MQGRTPFHDGRSFGVHSLTSLGLQSGLLFAAYDSRMYIAIHSLEQIGRKPSQLRSRGVRGVRYKVIHSENISEPDEHMIDHRSTNTCKTFAPVWIESVGSGWEEVVLREGKLAQHNTFLRDLSFLAATLY